MAKHPDVAVIGGGIVGLSCAHALATAGLTVELLDRQALGREASWAGAGIIPPGNPQWARSPLDHLRAVSVSHFPSFSARLESATGLPTGFRVCGGIEYLEPSDADVLDLWDDEVIEYGRHSADELRTLEPNLAFPGAGYILPGMAQMRNPWYLRALIADCERLGVRLRPYCPVRSWMQPSDNDVYVTLGSGEVVHPSKLLIATGAWADSHLVGVLGAESRIHPVRGQMLLYKTDPPLLNRIVIAGKRYLVPRSDGRLLVGSTEEPEAGYVKETTAEGIAGLRRFAESMVPALKTVDPETSWAGLRPASADGYPIIGRLPFEPNVYAAVGHFRAGIQLSLGTARLIADLILGRPPVVDPAPFRPGRSTSSGPFVPPRTAFRS